MTDVKMSEADALDAMRHQLDPVDDWREPLERAAAELRRLAAELSLWERLGDPHVLLAALKRGVPTYLTPEQRDELAADVTRRITPEMRASVLAQQELRAALDEAPTVALTDSATVELAWLEGWLQFANEWVGGECCGHGVRGECCGNPDPVTRRPAEVIEAMARRHRVLTAMLGEKGKEGGA